MTRRTERTRNTNDEATINDGVGLNATTSTTILAANADRVAVTINNNSSTKELWIKLQAASVDNDKKGIFLHPRVLGEPTSWTMPADNIYTGEISAIADSGTPNVYVTEY